MNKVPFNKYYDNQYIDINLFNETYHATRD